MNDPKDIQKLTYHELGLLADEIRRFLVDNVSKTGGHLASNLGIVELTLVLHRVFDSPKDSFVWDVGHQCYVHKILTGRKDAFSSLRQYKGLSGFPKSYESLHDTFIAGHSSNSISAAFAISCANLMSGDPHYAVAVVGDGAFTGGQIYEALNNAGRSQANLVIVLNDNEMSISPNVGALARYLSSIRSKPGYLKLKRGTEWTLEHIPFFGKHAIHTLKSSKSLLKYILYHDTFFEDMGMDYYGPVDGHNLRELERVLRRAKELHHPVVVHIETVKGKGYEFAEKDPPFYHGVDCFDVETGISGAAKADDFSEVFGRTLSELADQDPRICGVTAAMARGTGLTGFVSQHPNRFFDVGIAEEHAVTFAAGLAYKGYLPVFAVYSTFLQRSYDQILIDAAREGMHVLLAVDRAGIVGGDGETHQGIYDVSFLTSIPGVTVFSPSGGLELRLSLEKALYQEKGVVAIRYPKGVCPADTMASTGGEDYSFFPGEKEGLAISYGRISENVYESAMEQRCSFLKLLKIYPFSEELINSIMRYRKILIFEEAIQNGSIGEHLLLELSRRGFSGSFETVTLPNAFVGQGSIEQLLQQYHLDRDSISAKIKEAFQ